MGKAITKIPVVGGVVKGVTDTLFGEKTPGTPDNVIDLGSATGRGYQEQALNQFGGMLNNDFSANQIAAQENQARTNVEDQTRKAGEMVAQRGLGGTSLGLNAMLGQNKGLNDHLEAIRASQPMLKMQNLQAATSGINSIMNEQGQSKIFKQGTPAQGRSGGLVAALAPVAGQVAGGMAGSGAFNKFV